MKKCFRVLAMMVVGTTCPNMILNHTGFGDWLYDVIYYDLGDVINPEIAAITIWSLIGAAAVLIGRAIVKMVDDRVPALKELDRKFFLD